MNKETYGKITSKKEFSQLPRQDVERAYSHFERRQTTEEEKIKLTRNLLREVFSGFSSVKLFSSRKKTMDAEKILKKHLSTRERLPYYTGLYKRILKGLGEKVSVIDLGAGVNGLSYRSFKRSGHKASYLGVEAIGQLSSLVNRYFGKEKIDGKMAHASLFDLRRIKSLIGKTERPRAVFLFKVLDSLEMLERDFSKQLIQAIVPISDRIIVSFATESMGKRERFRAKRTWFLDFLKGNFSITDDFELGKERYLVFEDRRG